MLEIMELMNGEKQTRGGRPNVPVYSGSGLVPTYYSGSAVKSDVPYSKGAKLVGFLIIAGLTLFMLWLFWSVIIAQA